MAIGEFVPHKIQGSGAPEPGVMEGENVNLARPRVRRRVVAERRDRQLQPRQPPGERQRQRPRQRQLRLLGSVPPGVLITTPPRKGGVALCQRVQPSPEHPSDFLKLRFHLQISGI